MEATLALRLPVIEALCREYGVRSLALFGSAATGDFQPGSSDYDFLVELDDSVAESKAARWVGFAEALERALGASVDLVNPRYIENPIFLRAVDSTRVTLYERARDEAHS